ncbi:2-succinyl-5-enolpyruvyl-6-hydroxy-3-cyclohexene-1-carboxylic-acid synthase [Fulvivirga lutea]|uniref:2-succinyl-5-enolpyruvyl-6-hydroxy-3-cyclohexene-1-carboxylate synthase n=1 Tax=Fulvivirga lutea TaxID=2810512 RepID=A0A974WGT2_9BACT|nr:2-succinyl-5-enolpyruvyl-6-hydroxy-3-cyclohexene-1-carboxylic-acid synthase [Fulvivirga lutea]QSE96842.1 2-succinyl-5-enolpyruvyl-6-hydroxy-3-cyclohexene-1-carboxylic-acid synthase [Fulvivirga lutea]
MNYPHIFSVAEICSKHDIEHAVISPGSRSAPLTLAFARHKKIKCKVIPDERAAAFVAMGMAQQLNKPVALICTSGSAALNYYPAIAEAYFQQIPLLILTADRPPEWIDQLDGQTIRQENVYGRHVKRSYNIEADLSSEDAQWYLQRQVNEGIIEANQYPKGPVHINFPFREPLYTTETVEYPETKIIKSESVNPVFTDTQIDSLKNELLKFERKLIICGQNQYTPEVLGFLEQVSKELKIPVVGDIISNIHSIESAVTHSDVFLSSDKSGLDKSLKPDLLITIGKSILSKNLKIMLRKNQPDEHWHVQQAGDVADTYKSLTRIIHGEELEFLKVLIDSQSSEDFQNQKQENYYHIWQIEERKTQRHIDNFFPQAFPSEFSMIREVLSQANSVNLHLANSMAVRYANFIGIKADQKDITVFCNRGTSGIDGSTSTAIGASMASNKINLLISGDMAFLYDRNAFWHNYDYSNFRALVLNNHGGGIFRMINGPSNTPEVDEYFVTNQKNTAKHLAEEFGIEYLLCDKKSKINNYIKRLLEDDGTPKILEIESDSVNDKQILQEFKAAYNKLK